MRRLINNPGFLTFCLLYLASVTVLAIAFGYSPVELLLILGIFGLLLPAVVLLMTRRYPVQAQAPIGNPAGETRDLLLYLLLVVAFLVFGLDAIRAVVRTEPLLSVTILAAKLAVFVAGPAWLFRRRGYRWRDLFALRLHKRDAVTILVVGGLFILINAVIGQGPARIAASGYSWALLLPGMLFAFAWLLLEVGLVEEFFFRRLVQSRISAWTGSETSGLFFAAILFGLAHAPGYYLRWEVTGAELFSEPSLLFALCYSVAVISVAGLLMGVIWLRTRSLVVLVAVHAAGDLLPNTVEMMQNFRF